MPKGTIFTAWFDSEAEVWRVKFKRKQFSASKIRFIAVANGTAGGYVHGICERITEVEGELVIT